MTARPGLLALLFATATATATTACKTTESDAILTRGMYASISATADGTGSTTVGTSLFLGPPSDLIFVDLVAGDQLIAHNRDQAKVMTEQNVLNIVSHTATFPVDARDERFEIELRRQVDPGAPSSIVTLPAPFTLGAVPASVSRAAAFGVNWTGTSTDRMRWTADGSCIQSASGTIAADSGSVTMPAGTFQKAGGTTVPDTCEVRVTVVRERDGTVDPAFGEGGTATATQTRSVTFTSTP
jgi:hypothetical protein